MHSKAAQTGNLNSKIRNEKIGKDTKNKKGK